MRLFLKGSFPAGFAAKGLFAGKGEGIASKGVRGWGTSVSLGDGRDLQPKIPCERQAVHLQKSIQMENFTLPDAKQAGYSGAKHPVASNMYRPKT